MSGSYGDAQVMSETRLPTVVREMTSTKTPKSSSVDMDAELSFTDDFSSALQTIDGNTMLGAVNKIADVSLYIK